MRRTATALGHFKFGSAYPIRRYTPNAAFIDDPAVLSDKRLDSPQLGHFVNKSE